MPTLADRIAPPAPPGGVTPRRPVILATFSVRVEPAAEWMAIESALEAGAPLIVANVLWPPPSPTTMIRLQEDLESVRQTAARAAAWGLDTELLMQVSARRPARALCKLARERDSGLVVFGPDARCTGRRRLRRAAKAVRSGLDCLVWTADDAWA